MEGKYVRDRLDFNIRPFKFSGDTVATRRLTFFNQGPNKVQQFGEITKNTGASCLTEYDLEYRRKLK